MALEWRLLAAVALMAVAQPSAAQPPEPTLPTASTAPFSAAQLDQLLAPIALYPDPLLAQILMAATYPLEIVEADRWTQDPGHAALRSAAMATALDALPWDASVKSLVLFPHVLQMMDGRLDWLAAVGDAFLTQQSAVMDAVQRLRGMAVAAGSLRSTSCQTVSREDGEVAIEPADQSVVYVPVYDPNAAYGVWPDPDDPPYWFPATDGDEEVAVAVIAPLWGWTRWHWHEHRLDIDPDRFHAHSAGRPPARGPWQHDPSHRHGVAYRDPTTAARFASSAGTQPGFPRIYRGSVEHSPMPMPITAPAPAAAAGRAAVPQVALPALAPSGSRPRSTSPNASSNPPYSGPTGSPPIPAAPGGGWRPQ